MKSNPTVFICDDDEATLIYTAAVLEENGYKPQTVLSPKECLALLKTQGLPDLILLDINMPEMDGYTLCCLIRKTYPNANLPILFLTLNRGNEHERKAFDSGGQDFILKPFSPDILVARVRTHCENKIQKDQLLANEQNLQDQVDKKTQALAALQNITIFALTSLCGERDQETGSHILRTQLYMLALAQALQPNYKELTDAKIQALFRYAPLHDIGKIGIPDRVLLKPGKLTPEEFDIIKTHTVIGFRALEGAETLATTRIPELDTAKKIVRSHHEKWNGAGYPDHTKGEETPLDARIMAVSDVYDALRSKRAYKDPMSHKKAIEIITSESGTHFDPTVIAAFEKVQSKFERISVEYETTESELEIAKRKVEIL